MLKIIIGAIIVIAIFDILLIVAVGKNKPKEDFWEGFDNDE